MDHEQVSTQLTRSPFIQPMAGFLSWAVPIGELMIATLLSIRPGKLNLAGLPHQLTRVICALPPARLLGLYLSYGLMLLFAGYVYIMLHFAYDLPCSCGGIISKLSWRQHFYVNIGFTVLALVGILIYPKNKTQPSSAPPPKIAYT